jgi:hypothetical protein
MPFNPNIPQPSDNLKSKSQNDLLTNNQELDNAFGVDHYKFSSAINSGMHNQITTPPVSPGIPATAANQCKIFAYTPAGNAGLIQYSKPQNDGIPTPITGIHSTAAFSLAASATINIFNFTGSPRTFGRAYVVGNAPNTFGMGVFSWTTFFACQTIAGSGLSFITSGSSLAIRNNTTVTISDIYWTIVFDRLGPV